MPTVYVVQELTRYHCPKCNGTYSRRVSRPGEQHEYQCQNDKCGQRYYEGVLRPMHNLTPAAAFGTLKVLLTQHVLPINLQPIYSELEQKLEDFTDDDYLLPVGNPEAAMLSAMIASSKVQTLNILRWDRQTRAYIEVRVNV